ncbi:mediator of RNA polymerase II transcription subunit 12 [Beta vulgaris subsp. vulgaris]|uniref:mediator of RNA polymerase II transcription subunit 12 n=1 Tax=Beta vulgaris subsp. vulgaris TaxID=3555 RepID=UPI002036845F|nr:mediator of RNA polymerase II transcription subunit 12 [Beta vulgaris subsp. vulgaris]XP_048494345.1 mediator of RNA polymerase II transcription subunit 12 [Beta vulgaris subsp. vulgaris]
MQRYHAASCTSSVNNNTSLGGISNRDTSSRSSADSSSLSANFSLNSRRASALAPFRLKCEIEPLNSRLGPPDFHPQTLNCPEETLTKEYVQSGYRETVEGLEEAKEISVTQVNTFTKPVVLKCKEAIRKRLRAINESRAQKRKAGQVYGEPLSGSLLSKPGVFPEQKSAGEDFKKRWIEGLSQYHKSLRSLADHIPHGYRKTSLFEVLIRNNVPVLRATWFIKVTYLNQIRPGSSSVSSGSPDRIQLSRTEIWTKDVTDYLQGLLDELFSRNNSHSAPLNRDRSQPMLYAGSLQQKFDPASLPKGSEEPSLHFKWWYVVRILNWHHGEGLILSSQIIEWVFQQFQDKDLVQVMQFLLPIIYGVLEMITSCQTYVRKLVDVTLRLLKDPSIGGSDLVDNSRRAYTCSALVEMLRYLILSVPDTFVGLDCFPLPGLIMFTESDGSLYSKSPIDGEHLKCNPVEAPHVPSDKGVDVKYPSSWFRRVVSSIQKRTTYLAKAASPGYSGQNVAKAVQALDKALVQGDVQEAYKLLFEGFSESSVHEGWIAEVIPCLRSSLKWLRSVSPPIVYSVFLLCEWCTCDFRDFRTSPLHDVKFTGRKDFSQLYVAVRLMKQKMREMQRSEKAKRSSERRADGSGYDKRNNWRKLDKNCIETSEFFESPGPLHDIIVCWMDQHEAQKGEGSKRVQLLLIELTRSGIFSPLAYARQLLVCGIMDKNGSVVDPDRRKRHHRILKQLSVSCMHDVFDEAQSADRSLLLEAIHVYANERRLLLRGLLGDDHKQTRSANVATKKHKENPVSLPASVCQLKSLQSFSEMSHSKSKKNDPALEELKLSILEILLLPKSIDAGVDETQVSMKRSAGLISSKLDTVEATPGCEECRRAKRQKLGEEKYSLVQVPSSNPLDDEDKWWVRKVPKSQDAIKVDQPIKPSKQAPRGRQKSVRKTQSLNQIAAASRIEGSQGASTSHVCDNKIGCPHHRPVPEGDAPKAADLKRATNGKDIVSIGKLLKRLKFAEKRSISAWLISSVKQVVEETERMSTKGSQMNRPLSSDEKSSGRWKLGEDELSVILYLMDMCSEVPLAIRFLIWLFPKVLGNLNTPIHGGRNIMMLSRNVESHACEVKEPYLLSAIRRYENVIAAVDLIPEILSSAMHRAAAVLTSNGRLSGSPTFLYARYLVKKYGKVTSVIEWEKNFKATCDKRLISEFEAGKLQNGEFGFSFAVPAGVDDLDDFIRQKISGNRLSRAGMSMREIVQRCVDDALHHLFGKERKLFGPGAQKNAGIEKWDDGYQIAQQIIQGLMECIRQTGGAAQEGDPSLVSSAVSAIVGNVGPAIAKMPDFTAVNNHSNYPAPTGSLSFARRVLRIHINCLCLLKEALGERHSRAFEIALATEASSALAGVLMPGKGARGQFQLSPDAHEPSMNMSNDVPNNSAKVAVGRATKIAAAVSALIIGAIIHGVSDLERMVTVFRLREGLDLVQFVRSSRTHSNGNARSSGALKVENALEVYIHLFRLLVGNCRTVSDGVIVDLLGEPSLLALSRMQRTLPLNLVLPPAYSLFAFMIWRPFIFNITVGSREEVPQLLQSLTLAIGDAIKHAPFRDICLRDTHGFFDLVTSDATDAEFASILELNGSDRHLKTKAFIPLRGRLFLNALVDCKLPHSVPSQDDGNRLSGANDSKVKYGESETKISDRLARALDTLQPAKFHWQWVELRLFLSELSLIGKLDSNDTQSVAEAIRSLTPNPDKGGSLENENNFIPIVLTRLLVRPDAAPLLSEVVHLFGRSLEDSMLLHVKWFLEGHDVLFGRKSIRQRLVNFAESKSFSTKAQFWKPWGWCNSSSDALGNRGDKRRFETPSVEEGEVVEEDFKRHARGASKLPDREGLNTNQQFVTERALVELVLPCVDRSSDDSRVRFASELIKQMSNIEQQISGVASGSSKQTGSTPSGTEGSTNKASTRKSMKGSSPGLARRAAAVQIDTAPSSPAALRASVSLRLQLLVRLLPTICADGDSSGRSSRFMLASVILRLLGSRVVYEDMNLAVNPGRGSPLKEAELQMETCADVSLDLSGKNLFDWLLLVLHALLSSSQPSWLTLKFPSKTTVVSAKDFGGFDREILENLQGELDRMQLPDAIRWRIQTAMPILVPNSRTLICCQPPPLSSTALASLQPSIVFSSNQASPLPKNSVPSVRTATSAAMLGKSKAAALQPDNDLEVDPWMLLEDGAGSGPSSSNAAIMGGGDHANLRASSWLKGAIRVRRTDLTYIGAVDDDS